MSILPDAPKEAITIDTHQFIIHPDHLFTDVWYKFQYDRSLYAVRKLDSGDIQITEIEEFKK